MLSWSVCRYYKREYVLYVVLAEHWSVTTNVRMLDTCADELVFWAHLHKAILRGTPKLRRKPECSFQSRHTEITQLVRLATAILPIFIHADLRQCFSLVNAAAPRHLQTPPSLLLQVVQVGSIWNLITKLRGQISWSTDVVPTSSCKHKMHLEGGLAHPC